MLELDPRQYKELEALSLKRSFTIPLEVNSRLGLNSLYAGVHWSKRQRQAEEIHALTWQALREGEIPKEPFTEPVQIRLGYNSRLDIDNHGYLTKLIIDGLKGWVIEDDSKKYVQRITQEFWKGKGVRVEVEEANQN